MNDCPTFSIAKNHGNNFIDSDFITGWYLPNVIECSEFCFKLDRPPVNEVMLKDLINQNSTTPLSETDLYWTSKVPVGQTSLSAEDMKYA